VRQRTNGARERHTGRKMARQTMERLTGVNPAKYILSDSRKQDRQRGFENDLDIPFISALIEKGCEYCGAKNLRMSLDRVDNSMGHTKENVKPACRRCNWIRRDMPYEAGYGWYLRSMRSRLRVFGASGARGPVRQYLQ
jgi:ribosomal protein L36